MRVTESLWDMGLGGKAINGTHISSQVWLSAWGGSGAGWGFVGEVFGWQCHHHNWSRHWHRLVTEQRPVCHLTQQPSDKDASPSGFVMSGHTAPLCPSFTPPPARPSRSDDKGRWKQKESGTVCWTQSTLICHKWSGHKGEHTLGELTLYVTALTPIKRWVKGVLETGGR